MCSYCGYANSADPVGLSLKWSKAAVIAFAAYNHAISMAKLRWALK